MLEILAVAIIIGLYIAYGKVCYNQGISAGARLGQKIGIFDALKFLSKRKVIDFDEQGDIIFRINDSGGRGEAIDIGTD